MARKLLPSVTLRHFARTDLERIVAISRASYAEPMDESLIAKFVRGRGNILKVIANPDGEVVGYVSYKAGDTSLGIEQFAVEPASRRTGVGTVAFLLLLASLYGKRPTLLTVNTEDQIGPLCFLRAVGKIAVKGKKFTCESTLVRAPDGPDCVVFNFTRVKDDD